jgi:bilirubin oxidase
MATLTRRQLLAAGAALGIGAAAGGTRAAIAKTGTDEAPPLLDAASIPKYAEPLVVPPAMPQASNRPAGIASDVDYYEIAVRQFRQNLLPERLGLPTTVWSYGSVEHPETLNYPAFSILATVDKPVRVTWINGLVDDRGDYLPHLLPVDPTLHWANPPGHEAERDERPEHRESPPPYQGPVPIVTHLHGGRSDEESDGYPEAWYLPVARNIPGTFARVGSSYEEFRQIFAERWGQDWAPGTAAAQYANAQRASTLWFHDHTLGMTRLNVWTGPAGFYLLQGGEADLPIGVLPGAPGTAGTAPREIPIAIQDRSFTVEGELFYPNSRRHFDEFEGPYIPESDVPPFFNPEVFGTVMLANGRTWPLLQVEPRRYRLRLLNGCNSRFLILKIASEAAARPAAAVMPLHQVGGDGGFLASVVDHEALLLGPAERADVVVDFSGLQPGTELYLINEGPDEPFGGGKPGTDFAPANPETTGQILKFEVIAAVQEEASLPVSELVLPGPTLLGAPSVTRRLSLNEHDSEHLEGVGPVEATLGTVDDDGKPVSLDWDDAITEKPAVGATEIWELHNFTADAHPIHIHEVQFQVVERQPFGGASRLPEPWGSGDKDTVIAYPGEITRIKARFEHAGRFVWHCHILEHEDHEMMRPYRIGP